MSKIIFILLVSIATTEGIARNIDKGNEVFGLDLCVNKFLHTFPKRRTLFMYNEADFMAQILHKAQQPFVVINLNIELKDLFRLNVYNSYIFATDDVDLIVSFLSKFYKTRYYNPDAITFIAYRGSNLQELFNQLWEYFMINVIVVNKNLELYTYRPISHGNCTACKPQLLGSCFTYNLAKMKFESDNLYFKNCKFRIYAHVMPPFVDDKGFKENTGFEMMVLKEIVRKLKVVYTYVEHNFSYWGTKVQDGNYSMMLDKLYRKEAEIVMGGVNFTKTLMHDFDTTLVHCYASFSFFVPLAKPIKPWKNIFLIFDWATWLCTFTSLFLTFCIWCYWKKSNDLVYEILYLISMLVSAVSNKPSSLKLKIIFIVWAFCCLIIALFYQSPMVAFMTKPNYENQISTMDDLAESQLKLGGYNEMRSYFASTNPTFQEISRRWEDCSRDGSECMSRLFDDGNFAYIKHSRIMNYYQFKNKHHRVFKIKAHRILFAGTMYMKKAAPYLARFNSLLLQLYQSGLIYKWDKYETIKFKNNHDLETKPLKFDHFLGATILYCIGMSASVLCFICEIIYAKFNQNKFPFNN